MKVTARSGSSLATETQKHRKKRRNYAAAPLKTIKKSQSRGIRRIFYCQLWVFCVSVANRDEYTRKNDRSPDESDWRRDLTNPGQHRSEDCCSNGLA